MIINLPNKSQTPLRSWEIIGFEYRLIGNIGRLDNQTRNYCPKYVFISGICNDSVSIQYYVVK